MKLVVTGDWHFGVITDGLNRNSHIFENAIKIVEHCEEVGGIFLHLGDLFNVAHPDPDSYSNVIKIMNRLDSYKIPSIFITGNHDVSNKKLDNSLLPLKQINFDTIEVCDYPEIFSIDDLKILAFPYVSPSATDQKDLNKFYDSVAEKFLGDINGKKCIALGHFNVEGAVIQNDHILRNINIGIPKRLLVSENVKAIFNGHIHKQQVVNNKYGPNVYIPGNIEKLNFGERDDNKGFYEVDL